jgi:hypothetical protein
MVASDQLRAAAALHLGERPPGTRLIGALSERSGEIEIPYPFRESNPHFSVVQPLA